MADQSNEMGMVERVAAALFEQEHADTPQASAFHLQRLTLRKRYELKAHAAIEAMREPSEAVIAAIRDVTTVRLADGSEIMHGTSFIWTAALDAALSHDEVKG